MPIDPNIAMGAQTIQPQNPFGMLTQLGNLAEMGQRIQVQQGQIDARKRAQDDEDAINATVKRHIAAWQQANPNNDPNGPEFDYDAVGTDLMSQGRATANLGFQNKVLEMRKAQVDQLKTMAEASASRITTASQVMDGVHDEASFQTALPMVRKLVGQDFAGYLGNSYDPV